MRILKYFCLLLSLAIVSLFVFILTQSPSFIVKRTFTVDVPKETVYAYIRDLDNWSDWIDTQKGVAKTYDINLENLGTYTIRDEYSHPYDSLSQDILNDNTFSNIRWQLKDSATSTAVTFTFLGTLDLQTKFTTFFKGTPTQVASESLNKNIDAFIVHFIKQYKEYKVNFSENRSIKTIDYIYLESTSTITNLTNNIVSLHKELDTYCTVNNIQTTGHPFILLDQEETTFKESFTFKFAFPIKANVYLNPEEKQKTAQLSEQLYAEAILNGYYTFLPNAVLQLKDNIDETQKAKLLKEEPTLLILEESPYTSRLASAWKTKVLLPIQNEKENTLED